MRVVEFPWGRWAVKPSKPCTHPAPDRIDAPTADGAARIDPSAFGDPEVRAATGWFEQEREGTEIHEPKSSDDLPTELQPFAAPGDEGSLGYRMHLARIRRIAAMKG